jgi:hypothetical protein
MPPKKRRVRTNLTLDPDTLLVLQGMVDAGLYPNISRALDAATRRLTVYHQRRDEWPRDPGEDDSFPAPLT